MGEEETVLHVSFRGRQLELWVDLQVSLDALFNLLADTTGADRATLKLTVPGGKLLRAGHGGATALAEAGVAPGAKLLLLGSTQAEVAGVRASKDLPGLAGFDHELRVQAARRRQSSATASVQLPSGPHTFQSYEAWQRPGLAPPPSEALKLLYRLAADPGIVAIMRRHGWAVGKLSEMPPEGKVGVSPVCILGVNINAGQEISLRLRTDDLKGFRRYLSIRQTLCHELAHMVHSDHDAAFKALNSRLLRECEQAGPGAGAVLAQAAEGWALDAPPPEQAGLMARTAAASGRMLRQLAGDAALPAAGQLPGRLAGAAEAPRQREPEEGLGVAGLGHRDAATEAKERAAEALAAEAPLQPQPDRTAAAPAPPVPAPKQPGGEPAAELGSATGQQPGSSAPDAGAMETDSAAAVEDVDGQREGSFPAAGEAGEDPSAAYYRQARAAVETLVSSAGQQGAATALQTLATILKNALQSPSDPRFRRVRQQNAAFHARAGRWPGSLELLRAAGFVPGLEGQERVLRLSRNDPGLLWIGLSACEAALQSVAGAPSVPAR